MHIQCMYVYVCMYMCVCVYSAAFQICNPSMCYAMVTMDLPNMDKLPFNIKKFKKKVCCKT